MAYKRTELTPEQIDGQLAVCAGIRARNKQSGKAPLAMVDTYGCQQNEADSERIRGYLAEMALPMTRQKPTWWSSTPALSGNTRKCGCWGTWAS